MNKLFFAAVLPAFLPGATALQAHNTSLPISATTPAAVPSDSVQADTTAISSVHDIAGITVTRRKMGITRMSGAVGGNIINQDELFKAACCNLGESFTTNPSVDVNYADAATGARQIKLLGLNGSYVQMLTENLPNFRGSAAPYSLGYVPGTWMKSIQVSKGAASVKNGYEGITGQINVEYLKPEDETGGTFNLYTDTDGKFEANGEGNIHLSKKLMTNVLGHFENRGGAHDMNKDGFQDMPNTRQYNFQNRWLYKDSRYIMHAGLGIIDEDRRSGQTLGHLSDDMKTELGDKPLYRIGISTDRYEGYMKHAFILDPQHGTNIAWMTSADMQLMDAGYGYKHYTVNEKNVYSSLMFEHNFTPEHNLSVGVSFVHDYLGENLGYRPVAGITPTDYAQNALAAVDNYDKENVVGGYAQYTYNLNNRIVAMAGIRLDHSNLWGTFVTPRVHLKWQATDWLGLRLSAGKGYRTPHPLAEYNYLLASSRTFQIGQLSQESAWNFGFIANWNIPLFGETLLLNTEYYYTRFQNQTTVDFDSNPHAVTIASNDGQNDSHVFQIDATYPLFKGMTLTAAYRRNFVRETYGTVRMEKPLQSRYKGLLTASYKTPLGLWQFDVTAQLNGSGRMPTPYTLADGTPSWNERFKAYPQLNVQVTRWFRHFSVYAGGENLTNYKQQNPVIDAMNAWGPQFDTNMVYGPIHGAMAYVGIRVNLGNRLK